MDFVQKGTQVDKLATLAAKHILRVYGRAGSGLTGYWGTTLRFQGRTFVTRCELSSFLSFSSAQAVELGVCVFFCVFAYFCVFLPPAFFFSPMSFKQYPATFKQQENIWAQWGFVEFGPKRCVCLAPTLHVHSLLKEKRVWCVSIRSLRIYG